MRTARSAFLLEIDDASATGADEVRGHVEHVLTGRALDFRSWANLRAFVEEVTEAPSDSQRPADRPLAQ